MSCCNTYNLGCWNYCGSVSFGIAEETGSYTGVFTSGNTVVSQTVVIQDGDPFVFYLSLLNENAEYTLKVYFNGELLDIEVDGLLYDKFTLKTQFYGQTSTATPTSCTPMCEEIYDPTNVRADVFDYNNLHTTAVGDGVTITGTGTTLDPFVSVGGGGGTPTIQDITYAALYALYNGGTLVPLQYYRITDFATIYDQSISDVTKTAAGEVLIVQASDTDKLFPNAFSESFPTDIIIYDVSVNTTYVNAAAAKGKITYRESADGNKANYDWRKVLMYNSNTMAEALTFDLAQGVYSTEVTTPTAFTIANAGFEFPASYITGNCFHNPDNLLINTYVIGDFSQNSGNIFFGSSLGIVNQVTNSNLSGTTIGGEFSQCSSMAIDTVSITGNLTSSVTGTWASSTFGENVNKCIEANFNNTTVTGRIDRLVNSVFLNSNFGGRLFWCESIAVFNSDIDNDFRGVNSLSWTNTDANCKVEQIKGITQNSEKIGFKDCTITGTTVNSVFGNLIVECLVDTKTITQALYPELFSEVISKTIYKTPDNDVFYRYLDDTNTWIFTQIA